jgi:branched-chain amino acid transport system permease protein
VTRIEARRDATPDVTAGPTSRSARGRIAPKRLRSTRLLRKPVAFTLLAIAPLFVHDGYVLQLCSLGFLYGVLAMGVVVSYGYTNVPNMSQGTIYGVGAYAAADAMLHVDLPFPLAVLFGGVCGAVVGCALGLTTMRVQGNYWWLITIAFSQVAFIIFNSWKPVTGGEGGLIGIPIARVGSHEIINNRSYYYLGLTVMALVYFLYARFISSRVGLAARAVGIDEVAAKGLGIAPNAVKVVAMVLAGFGAGLAGACLPAITGYIDAGSFTLTFSFATMIFAIVGGLSNLSGSVAAAVGLTVLTSEVTTLVNDQLFIYGGVLLVALFVRLYVPRLRLTRTGPAHGVAGAELPC